MKNLFKVFAYSVVALSTVALTSCHFDDVYVNKGGVDTGSSASISIDTEEQSLARFGVDIPVAVTADSYWTAESSQSWAVPVPSSGKGNGTVTVSVAENETNDMRRATVTFTVYQKSSGWKWDKAELAITQSATDEAYIEGDVEKLVSFIKTVHSGVSSSNGTATLAYTEDSIEAVVLANYGDGNIGQILAVGDNRGYPDSAILLYDSSFGSSAVNNYPVGSVVKVSGLMNATYNNYYGLRELKGVTATKTGTTTTVKVPELTISDILTNKYQGQYVAVKDVHATDEWHGKPWIAADNQTVVVTDETGATLSVRMGKSTYAPKFAEYAINSSRVGTLKVLAEYYSSGVQVMPVYVDDVIELSDVALVVSQTTVVLDAEAGSSAQITVLGKEGWTATTTGSGFTVDPMEGDGNKNVVTITSTAAQESAMSVSLGTIVFSGADNAIASVEVRQKGSGNASSIEGLYDYILVENLKNGGSLSKFGEITGYVAANNNGGNFNNTLSIVDNTGKPYSAMLFYGTDCNFTNETLPVGSKVTIDFSAASYAPYNGLPEVQGAVIKATGETAEIVVPKLSVAASKDAGYLGMYICVEGVAPAAEGYWNNSGSGYVNTTLTDATGAKLDVRVHSNAEFANDKYIAERGNLYGVMEIYSSSYQIFPLSHADVAAFAEPTEPLMKIDTEDLTFIAQGEQKVVNLTVKNIDSYTVSASVDDNHFSTAVADNKLSVMVTAPENQTGSAINATMTITVSYTAGENTGTLTKTVALKQNASVAADATKVTISLSSIEAATGGEIAKSYIGTVADPSSWLQWVTDEVKFAAVRIQRPAASCPIKDVDVLQIQGNTSDVTKQGFICNTESLVDIQQVVVVLRATSATALNVSIFMGDKPATAADYAGTEVTPTSNTCVQDDTTGQYIHTVSYDFAGNNYPYFKLINKTKAVFYAESITIAYKK